jgi:hypothetical protein
MVERVKDPLVLGPGDELVWRVGLNVAVYDAWEVEGQVLDSRGEGYSRWICNFNVLSLQEKEKIIAQYRITSGYQLNVIRYHPFLSW